MYKGVVGRVARCPVFNRTVRYFGSLSGIKMKVIPDNACVRYFESSWYSPFFLQSVARLYDISLKKLSINSKVN